MITINKVVGKDKDLLLNDFDKNDIHYKFNEKPAKLFKQKKYELTYIAKEDVIEYINEFLKVLETSLNCKIDSKVNYENDCYNIILNSQDNSLLIGKEGRTINSVQLLLHQMINNLTGFNLRISVDSSKYKEKKVKRLENEVTKIAIEVKSSKITAKLDPMNSYERRIVHSVVSKYKELKTLSEGQEPNRYVIISYKED